MPGQLFAAKIGVCGGGHPCAAGANSLSCVALYDEPEGLRGQSRDCILESRSGRSALGRLHLIRKTEVSVDCILNIRFSWCL